MAHKSDMHTKMKGRNLVLLGIILAFVVLIVAVTMVKFGGGA